MPLNRNQDFMFEDTTKLTTNAQSVKGALNEVNASLAEKASHYISVQNMKQDNNLKVGDICVTISYRNIGDLGGAKYTISSTGTPDDMSVIQLNNGKFAIFTPNQEGFYPEQFGAYGYPKQDQTSPNDSTAQFQALINYLATNNIGKPILMKQNYYVHELVVGNKMPYFKGDQAFISSLTYNGAGGTGSNIISYTDQSVSSAYATGGFENVSLLGNNHLNNNPIAEYGVLFQMSAGNNTSVDGIDWGYKLNNVHFSYFLKDGFNALQSWVVNFTIDKVRIDACNEYGINIPLNVGYWVHIRDFTVDHIPRNNPYFISSVASINGGSNLCGYAFLNIVGDGQGIINIENARLEGNSWLRHHPTDSNLYSNIYITSSSTGMGSIEIRGISGGGNGLTSNVHLVKFLNNDMGAIIHNYSDLYYQNAPIGYARNGSANNGITDSGTRIGQTGSMMVYMPPVYNNGRRGITLNGMAIDVETNSPSSLNNFGFYRMYDIILRTKANIYLDFESTRNSLGYYCSYPTSGFGVNKLISQATISVNQGDSTISWGNITSIFGNGALPVKYMSITITYSDSTTQVVNVGTIDYTAKTFTLMKTNDVDGTHTDTISKTDAGAKINITVCKFKPIGYLKEILTGTALFNGDGAMTSKTIAHGCAATPTYYNVEAGSADAGTAGIKYVTADATNLTVYFNTPPITGTNNVKLIWKAED